MSVFLTLTFALGYGLQWFIVRGGYSTYSIPYLLFALTPGAVALALSWFADQGFDDFALTPPAELDWAYAYLTPVAVTVGALTLAVAFGAVRLNAPGGAALVRLGAFTSTLGVAIALVPALGFELGWRGYLLSQAERAEIPLPSLLVGLCAAAWQWPLVAFGELGHGQTPLISIAFFTVATCGFSVLATWLRARSSSLGPVVLAHATHAVWLNQILPHVFEGPAASHLILGEAGLGVALGYALVASLCLRF